MYTTDVEELPNKPGRWRVTYWDQGSGSILRNGPKRVWKEDLTMDEAMEASTGCKNKVNGVDPKP